LEARAERVEAGAIRYELLKESHIPQVLEIEKAANSAPWSDRSFRNEITNPQAIFLVAFYQNKLVGFGGLWTCVDEAHITTLAVAEEYRRRGIGRAIMLQLLRRGQERGMTCSTLEVRAGNSAAIELYKSLGYLDTARRKGYYPDNREDAVVMWLHDLQVWAPPV
jgi:ribosomal-protein-alanine N-acetyltransferase